MLKKDLVSLLREELKKSPMHLKKSYELKLGYEIIMSLKGDDLDLWIEKDGHIEDVLADASGQFERGVSSSKENIEKILGALYFIYTKEKEIPDRNKIAAAFNSLYKGTPQQGYGAYSIPDVAGRVFEKKFKTYYH